MFVLQCNELDTWCMGRVPPNFYGMVQNTILVNLQTG